MFGGRTMLVKKFKALPIEAIVRGYICGSAWQEYQKTGIVCGIKLPSDMHMNQQFLRPIFTPSTKAAVGCHDENITCSQMSELIGNESAARVHKNAIAIYEKASAILWNKGIILADAKLEFGIEGVNHFLIDECFTPDSSRFWNFKDYKLDGSIVSMDKQYLRDWLDAQKWDRNSDVPNLPDEVTDHLSKIYLDIYEKITGEKLA